jgi:hypothetical protein
MAFEAEEEEAAHYNLKAEEGDCLTEVAENFRFHNPDCVKSNTSF